MTTDAADKVARTAQNSKVIQVLARSGYAVNGVLHGLIGILAITVALGSAAGSADQTGALQQLASNPAGKLVLWALVVGLFALGIWQIFEGILVPGADPAKRWAKRISELGKAVAYISVAVTALTFAAGGASSSSASTQGFIGQLLAQPGGVFAVGAIGVLVLAIGIYFIVKGVRKKFLEDIQTPGGTAGDLVTRLGVIGYIAKGIALAVVGILFLVAAFTLDLTQATGLDGALKSLASLPFGQIILTAVGLGLVAFGIYLFARARYAKL